MQNLVFIFVAVFGFLAVGGLGLALAGGGATTNAKTAKRMQAVAAAGPSRSSRGAKAPADAAAGRRKQMMASLKASERQERKAKLTVEARIQQAGLALSVRNFWIASVGVGVVAAMGVFAASANPLFALGGGFAAGFGVPRWVLGAIRGRRHGKFTEEFPNAIDIIVRGIKSGLPVHDCLRVIATESPDPVGMEFQKLVEGLGMGQSIDLGMEKMHKRMSTSEVRFFSIVLAIQQKSGGNLAEALSNLSTVLRARKMMREKVKAMSGEAVASAFIIGALPVAVSLLIQVVSPAYLKPLFATPGGHKALLVGLLMMSVGIWVMRRMINFKI